MHFANHVPVNPNGASWNSRPCFKGPVSLFSKIKDRMFPIFDLRFNSSSGKLEFTSQRVKKGEFLQGSRPIESHISEAEARAVQGVKLGGIIILFVWLVPSREAPQVFLTYRGISKDSHDPQSASVCARRIGWGGIGRRQHDVVHTVPPILPRHPVCLCLIHPSVGNMCLEKCSVIRETELRDKPLLLPPPPYAHFRQASRKWTAHNAL